MNLRTEKKMHSIFECLVDGVRHLGVSETVSASPSLYPLNAPLASILIQAETLDIESVIGDIIRTTGQIGSTGALEMLAPLRPKEDTQLLISGYGLTHTSKMSAELQKGRTPRGEVPTEELPFCFLKGFANSAKVPGQPLRVWSTTRGICEEAELVLIYVVQHDGVPKYVGYTFGNDLTDIARFRINKSQLAYCKLYDSGVLPRLYLGQPPQTVDGTTTVHRSGETVWRRAFETGVERIFFDVKQMTRHLWQHATLRVPGTVHYVMLGADRNTTDFGFQICTGDTVELDFGAWGKLSNCIESVDDLQEVQDTDPAVTGLAVEA
jgi:hypothetical protein